jgi:superfamily II DNA helicase RecQ
LVGTAATGAGKSVTFFLPMFFEKGGVTVIVCPLKGLGDQHYMMKYGFVAILLTAETITTDVINASAISLSGSLTS